jgi:hypothetical protein
MSGLRVTSIGKVGDKIVMRGTYGGPAVELSQWTDEDLHIEEMCLKSTPPEELGLERFGVTVERWREMIAAEIIKREGFWEDKRKGEKKQAIDAVPEPCFSIERCGDGDE